MKEKMKYVKQVLSEAEGTGSLTAAEGTIEVVHVYYNTCWHILCETNLYTCDSD